MRKLAVFFLLAILPYSISSTIKEYTYITRNASGQPAISASTVQAPTPDTLQSLMETSCTTHMLRDSFLKDKYRPAYHFVIPEGKGVPFDPLLGRKQIKIFSSGGTVEVICASS